MNIIGYFGDFCIHHNEGVGREQLREVIILYYYLYLEVIADRKFVGALPCSRIDIGLGLECSAVDVKYIIQVSITGSYLPAPFLDIIENVLEIVQDTVPVGIIIVSASV